MIWGPLIAAMLSQHPSDLRCTLRVSAKAVYVDGDAMTSEQAIAKCKQTTGAVLVVADGAPASAGSDIRARLVKAGIKIYVRGVVGDQMGSRGSMSCLDNPLGLGCD